jgi:transposase-like protein
MADREVPVSRLVGAAEIARRLGCASANLIHSWRRRYPDFPQPVAHLEMGFVWDWAEIEEWARRTDRLPDNP